MIKVYTDHEYLNEDNRKRIFPLLFDMVYKPNPKTQEHFCFTRSLEDANVAIFPVDIISFLHGDQKKYLQTWIDEASKYEIEIWVYAAGDFGVDLQGSNIKTFRFGGFDSKMNTNSQIMPAFINDPYDEIMTNDFYTLPKKTKPNIGFVGNADGSILKLFKEYFLYLRRNFRAIKVGKFEDYHGFYPSSYKRYRFLDKMSKSIKLDCNFILRKKYRAKEKNAGNRKDSTLEFFTNIQNNLYIFCLRGNGNFSIRFYEALIMGRIPVLVDTDVRLPFANTINWSKHCLLVSEKNLLEKIVSFHNAKSQVELEAMQFGNRKLIKEKLNRIDYFIQFSKQISKVK